MCPRGDGTGRMVVFWWVSSKKTDDMCKHGVVGVCFHTMMPFVLSYNPQDLDSTLWPISR